MVSVIIPVYNGQNYIRETIEHILASIYSDIEVIAVDDGSTDNSLKILLALQKQDARVRVFSKENGGVASARNFGVSQAKGDALCFCDQDDVVRAGMYERMYTRLRSDESDLCICSCDRLIGDERINYDMQKTAVYTAENGQIVRELLYPILFNGYDVPVIMGEGNHYPNIWTCMFRKSFWDENALRFRTYVRHEDDLLVKAEALCKAQKVSTLSYAGYSWRIHTNSGTFAHEFIEDIGAKQDACLKDLTRSLKAAGMPSKEIGLFQRVFRLQQYVDAVHNLTNKRVQNVREYCEREIYARHFDKSIRARKYLKKGRIKPGVLLPLLHRKMWIGAYAAEVGLDACLWVSLHSGKLTKLERWVKRK